MRGPTHRLGLEGHEFGYWTEFVRTRRLVGATCKDPKGSGGSPLSSSEEGSLPETCFEMALRGQTRGVIAWGALLGLLGGCESKPEPGEVDSGLPEGKLLNELSLEEVNAICRAEVRARNETALGVDRCLTFAFDEATTAYMGGNQDIPALESACMSFYESCTQAGDAATLAIEDCALESLPPVDCAATVRELEACWTDQIEFLARPTPTCAEVSIETLEWGVDRLTGKHNEAPPSCSIFYDKCPSGFPR